MPFKLAAEQELNSTLSKSLFNNDSSEITKDSLEIYKGASFSLWSPSTSEIYARAELKKISDHLYNKRLGSRAGAHQIFLMKQNGIEKHYLFGVLSWLYAALLIQPIRELLFLL